MTADTEVQAGLTLGFKASIDSLAAELKRQNDQRYQLKNNIHTFTIPPNGVNLSGGAGTLTQPNLYGPVTGMCWDIRRISCTGFTAGTVTVYLNAVGGEIVAVFSAAGVLLCGKGQIPLNGNDTLVFSAAGITGSVTVSIGGIGVTAPLFPDYLL